MQQNYIDSLKRQFTYYKGLGEKAIAQTPESKLFEQFNKDSNSIAVIVKHLHGNMLSRWTDFFTTDGEKEWRNRDFEFENDIKDRNELITKWNEGWLCFFNVLDKITPGDLGKIIYIRNEGHTVMEAFNRQLSHYCYHIGQIVFLAKMFSTNWESLSIPKNKSLDYNNSKFKEEKGRRHFTDL